MNKHNYTFDVRETSTIFQFFKRGRWQLGNFLAWTAKVFTLICLFQVNAFSQYCSTSSRASITFQNNTNCTVKLYCYEQSTDRRTYFMGDIRAGSRKTIQPSARTARVYAQYGSRILAEHWTSSCSENRSFSASSCSSTPSSCSVSFRNTGCQSAEYFWNDNGRLRSYGHIAAGATKSINTTYNGHKWVFRVGSSTVGNYTVNCRPYQPIQVVALSDGIRDSRDIQLQFPLLVLIPLQLLYLLAVPLLSPLPLVATPIHQVLVLIEVIILVVRNRKRT